MELLDLPPDILSLVFDSLADDIGIRTSVLYRGCSRAFDRHTLHAACALPKFEGTSDADIPAYLRRELSMHKSLVVGLVDANSDTRRQARALTRVLPQTVDLAARASARHIGAHTQMPLCAWLLKSFLSMRSHEVYRMFPWSPLHAPARWKAR